MKTSTGRDAAAWLGSIVLTGLLGFVDWKTGYELNFFAFYFLPVGIAAWYVGIGASVIIALASSVVWFMANEMAGRAYPSSAYAVWNTIIRLAAFLAIGWSLGTIRRLLVTERETTEKLRRTLAEIKILEGLLPICAQCKNIRNEAGVWQPLEVYFTQHSAAQFSHGYCPECLKKALQEADAYEKTIRPGRDG